jgi:hypothetical protein
MDDGSPFIVDDIDRTIGAKIGKHLYLLNERDTLFQKVDILENLSLRVQPVRIKKINLTIKSELQDSILCVKREVPPVKFRDIGVGVPFLRYVNAGVCLGFRTTEKVCNDYICFNENLGKFSAVCAASDNAFVKLVDINIIDVDYVIS